MKRIIITLIALTIVAFHFTATAGDKSLDVVYGPWIQNVTEDSFTVLFTTAERCLCWVEAEEDDGSEWHQKEHPAFWEAVTGRRVVGTFHSIKVTGLKRGARYRYRIMGKPVLDDDSPYGTDYAAACAMPGMHSVRTLDSSAKECRFTMVNDMHFNDARYTELMSRMDKTSTDFIVLNGDIVSFSNYQDTLIKHTFMPIKDLCGDFPVFFARGNHETRGREFYLLPKAFPTSTGEFYYTFRQGPVAFIVLDGGEDKCDSDVEYSGTAEFDAYREKELEWLKVAVKDPQFASAPKKVCIIHIPALDEPDAWHSQHWIAQNFTPLLNEAGIDVMLSGHHHRYILGERGKYGNNFPIVVNSNVDRLDFSATDKKITIKIYDLSGALIHKLEY